MKYCFHAAQESGRHTTAAQEVFQALIKLYIHTIYRKLICDKTTLTSSVYCIQYFNILWNTVKSSGEGHSVYSFCLWMNLFLRFQYVSLYYHAGLFISNSSVCVWWNSAHCSWIYEPLCTCIWFPLKKTNWRW